MIDWYKKVVFENYANFSGRARRSEYWYYTLMTIIISIVLMVLDEVLGLKFGATKNSGILNTIYSLAVLIPGLAVSVRRLHDIGKSGKLLLLFYVVIIALAVVMVVSGLSMFMTGTGTPGIGFFIPFLLILAMSIWMLVLYCTEGNQGANKYGADPKSSGEEINEIGLE
jgi:uncharacterized membrane protein YhaH (DUF805 family)